VNVPLTQELQSVRPLSELKLPDNDDNDIHLNPITTYDLEKTILHTQNMDYLYGLPTYKA
jgi:hypothetical protein